MHSIHGRAPAIATGLASSPPRPVGLGRHRRRRRAVHRRQPPDPRPAPQREPEDPAVQQPDLRPDQGPVLARPPRVGKITKSTPMGSLDAPVQPGLAGARRRGVLRRPHHRLRPQAPHRACCARRPPTRARRWSRSTRTATSSTTAPSSSSRTPTRRDEAVIRLEHGQPIRFGADGRQGRRPRPATGDLERRRRCADGDAASVLVHDAHAEDPTTAFALSRLADPDTLHHTPIGVFRDVERPVYDTQIADQLGRGRAARQGRPGRAARRRRHLGPSPDAVPDHRMTASRPGAIG